MNEVINSLKEQVDYCIESGEDLDEASWTMENGVILTPNQAQKLIDAFDRQDGNLCIGLKFNQGDVVYPIRENRCNTYGTCGKCGGRGVLTYKETGEETYCPECRGLGHVVVDAEYKWIVDTMNRGRIGAIKVEIMENVFMERYMLETTGVGSGVNWEARNLFRDYEDAEKECKRRNKHG